MTAITSDNYTIFRSALRKLPKDWKPLLQKAYDQDWRFRSSRKGIMLYPPQEESKGVCIHLTPAANKRGLQNKISELRRSGLSI